MLRGQIKELKNMKEHYKKYYDVYPELCKIRLKQVEEQCKRIGLDFNEI